MKTAGKRSVVLFALALLGVVLLLSACGTEQSNPTPTAIPTAALAAAPSPTQVVSSVIVSPTRPAIAVQAGESPTQPIPETKLTPKITPPVKVTATSAPEIGQVI